MKQLQNGHCLFIFKIPSKTRLLQIVSSFSHPQINYPMVFFKVFLICLLLLFSSTHLDNKNQLFLIKQKSDKTK